MKLSHWERNQKRTDGIFWVLRNLEKQNNNFERWKINCGYYEGLDEIKTWIAKKVDRNNFSISEIYKFIDLVNSREGYEMDPVFMDEIFKEVWESCKTDIRRVMKNRDKLVDAINVIYTNKKAQREILNTFKMKKWKGIKKAKDIYEVIPLTMEAVKLIEPPK